MMRTEVSTRFFLKIALFAFAACAWQAGTASTADQTPDAATAKRRAALEVLLKRLPPNRTDMGRVSFLDETFDDWLARTGALPPDFDRMPSIPFLPDPLILDEGGANTPIVSREQWQEKRRWMKEQLEYYVTGTSPPKPDNLKVEILEETKNGETTLRTVLLTFGPEHRAKLTVEVIIPPGKGPFPVFLSQWNHREWALVAVRRGYIGCLYAGADAKDDTEAYSEIWAGQYDFNRLTRRAYGASRAIDYLYTLPEVDRGKIGITGHSRNGDQSFIAAAFDERITAVIPSSGTGMELPWRYSAKKYDVEDVALLPCGQPSWFQPRLRFFFGREHKLPIDQHMFMALIAPRGLMLSTAINEGAGNPWGSEQAFQSARKVYQFLGAEDRLAIRFRQGLHGVCARDMEDYLDFFDYIFGRGGPKPENRLVCNYSFDQWRELTGESIDPKTFPIATAEPSAAGKTDWNQTKADIRRRLRWALGEEPAGAINPGPRTLRKDARGEASFGTFLERPKATPKMRMAPISPYNGFGDQLFGYLYYPAEDKDSPQEKQYPVVIYLHEYDYSKGFNSYHRVEPLFQSIVNEGYAVFAFDMLGFGNRIEEGTRFYQRYPHWTKMGKMVLDVQGAVEALSNLDLVDGRRIYVAGYALGGTVGLYAAALDERIAGVVSVAGLTPMRVDAAAKGIEGVRLYSHLHGLLPRLGFFVGCENRLPYDFDDVLACIAPRPILVVAPQFDKDAPIEDVTTCVDRAKKLSGACKVPSNIEVFSPDDFNEFSNEMRTEVYRWLRQRLTDG